jgi:hypothetical protein
VAKGRRVATFADQENVDRPDPIHFRCSDVSPAVSPKCKSGPWLKFQFSSLKFARRGLLPAMPESSSRRRIAVSLRARSNNGLASVLLIAFGDSCSLCFYDLSRQAEHAQVIGVFNESHKPHRSFRVLLGDGNQKGRSARAALWFCLSGPYNCCSLQPCLYRVRWLLLVAVAT